MIDSNDPLAWCALNGLTFHMEPGFDPHFVEVEIRKIIYAKHPPEQDMLISHTKVLSYEGLRSHVEKAPFDIRITMERMKQELLKTGLFT